MQRKPTKSVKLKSKKKTSKKRKSPSKSTENGAVDSKKVEVDILSPAAMLNAYYICHDAPECLQKRGFSWPGGSTKAKKGKKKRKKKKK